MKPAILVTGAAGFIAFHVVSRLLRDGHRVVGVDNFDPFYDRAIKERNLRDLQEIADETGAGFHFIEADILELQAGSPELKGEKLVEIIHLAAKAGVRPSLADPKGYLRTNVAGTLAMLELARERGVRRFLFGSSSSVYGDSTPAPFREDARADQPISPYAASKRSAELYCSNYAGLYGLSVACLRFFTVYGPRQRPDLAIHKFARQIRSGEPITLFGTGDTERDYTYVDDIVQGVMGARKWAEKAPKGAFEIFNLGGSATTSLKRLVELIESSLGTPAEIRWEPAQPGDVQRTYADVTKAGRELGYSPEVTIEEGIRRFTRWFLERKQPRIPRKKAA